LECYCTQRAVWRKQGCMPVETGVERSRNHRPPEPRQYPHLSEAATTIYAAFA